MTCKISVKCINGRYPAVPPSPRMNLFKTEGAKEHLTRLSCQPLKEITGHSWPFPTGTGIGTFFPPPRFFAASYKP